MIPKRRIMAGAGALWLAAVGSDRRRAAVPGSTSPAPSWLSFRDLREGTIRLKAVCKRPDFAAESASSGQSPVSQSDASEPGGSDDWT
jgi:hypothetical protein